MNSARPWPSREILFEWLRFLAVGSLNTAFGYCLYAACIWFGAGYLLATTVSMIGGVFFNYRTTGAVVFARRDGSFARFVGCYFVVLICSVAFLEYLDKLGVNPYISGLLVGLPAAALSFVLLRTFVFTTAEKT